MTQQEVLLLKLENAKLCMEILNLRVELATSQAAKVKETIEQLTKELENAQQPQNAIADALGIDPSRVQIQEK